MNIATPFSTMASSDRIDPIDPIDLSSAKKFGSWASRKGTCPPDPEVHGRADAEAEPSACEPRRAANEPGEVRTTRKLYDALLAADAGDGPSPRLKAAATSFLHDAVRRTCDMPVPLPESAAGLERWLDAQLADTGKRYRRYLERRKAGCPREYFGTRTHALSFLRAVAPTKLVDGAWLHGLLAHWQDTRINDLVVTYVEELGDGHADLNHVLLYRRLLQSHGLDDWADQPDLRFEQGAIQLALGACADGFLPEVVGFNLGYEQLPLHLLITAYELDELGIDPTYFSLHVTVDNAASGHARRAIRAVETLPALADDPALWQRVRKGFRLGELGFGSTDAVAAFDLDAELLRVLQGKRAEGAIAHSDHCRIEGRTVNQWLDSAEGVGDFVDALARKGWLRRGSDPRESRFWQLLQGPNARMFGVFSDYELQVVYDWLRGDAASDGASYRQAAERGAPEAPRPFRLRRRDLDRGTTAGDLPTLDLGDGSVDAGVVQADAPDATLRSLRLMGPAHHWTPAGLAATRRFANSVLRAP